MILFLLLLFITLPSFSQEKGKINIPDLKGYTTLKCDFHLHTVFSDATVWPTVRVDEAYREGLDVIALTDHLGRAHKDDVTSSQNRPYEIAEASAKAKGIILIRGGEISPKMPPGHINAIFLTDVEAMAKKRDSYWDALQVAKAQNAFIFWNHPGGVAYQPDTTLWWNEHTQLLEQGMMHGIEVVNNDNYFPEAHRWCLEKKLTMFGNSDSHGVIDIFEPGKHRAMTLVFARSKTPEAIREALDERRTAVYHNDFIIGEEKYLKELFENALEWKIEKSGKIVNGGEEVRVTVKNKSDLTFYLKKASHDRRITYFRTNPPILPFTIAPRNLQTFTVRLLEGIQGGDVNFIVENFLVQPDTGMKYNLKIQ